MDYKEDYESVYKNYINCAWKYAKCYNDYTNELETYNKIRTDKINEYINNYTHMLYSKNTAIKLAYGKINKSITLKNQYIHLENVQKKLKKIEITYNNLYNKLFLN
jgi:hypothetical protein